MKIVIKKNIVSSLFVRYIYIYISEYIIASYNDEYLENIIYLTRIIDSKNAFKIAF